MTERIERELLIAASPEEGWDTVAGDGWLADEGLLDRGPGAEGASRRHDGIKTGGVGGVRAPGGLAFWGAGDGEPATRVELPLTPAGHATLLRIVETRPLELLDLERPRFHDPQKGRVP